MAFTAGGGNWGEYVDIDLFPADVPVAQPQLAVAAAPSTMVRKLKYNLVLDQSDESEIPPCSELQHETWYQNYISVAFGPPQAETEPTQDQLTCLDHRVRTLGRPPYVDFGVWTPFNRKVQRGMKFKAWIPTGAGEYTSKEIPGPSNFVQWQASWRVFAVACRMLLCVSSSSLDMYMATIEKLVTLFPE
eukprot:12497617-Heterocapsa_arctica.AAC.1